MALVAHHAPRRRGTTLVHLDPPHCRSRVDNVPAPGLAHPLGYPGAGLDRGNRHHGVLSPLLGPSRLAHPPRGKRGADLLRRFQRLRAALDLGRQPSDPSCLLRHRAGCLQPKLARFLVGSSALVVAERSPFGYPLLPRTRPPLLSCLANAPAPDPRPFLLWRFIFWALRFFLARCDSAGFYSACPMFRQ